jgi:DNA ligase-1
MRLFAALFDALDRTTSTNEKVEAMVRYFREARPEDAAWVLFFLTGQRLKRLLTSRQLWEWSVARTGLQEWLLSECYSVVGDGAETIALLVGRQVEAPALPLADWVEERLMRLPALDPAEQRAAMMSWWDELEGTALLLLNKMVTGELRVGVSHRLVVRAVARFAGLDEATVAHRLSGDWRPAAPAFAALVAPGTDAAAASASRPYPFYLASPLEGPVDELGDKREWLVEWKWDGIRAQLIRRGGDVWLWSRGEELVTERFPEIAAAAARLADGAVIDGEIMAYREGALPFAILQKRIGRKALTRRVLAQAPAALLCYDLLEHGGSDIREQPLSERRARLDAMLKKVPTDRLVLSPEVAAPDWETVARERLRSRDLNVEGVMIKRLDSVYQVGRKRGDWWKWKIDPYSVDAVLVYAQPGHGRRANLLTDYTFAVWDRPRGEGLFEAADAGAPELVPFAKAYSGLSDEEIARLDKWIRQHTIERFGPVRAVEPVQVFELHFEGIAKSSRHRSGVAVRFPRIARWREDKKADEADTLDRVKGLMRAAR